MKYRIIIENCLYFERLLIFIVNFYELQIKIIGYFVYFVISIDEQITNCFRDTLLTKKILLELFITQPN